MMNNILKLSKNKISFIILLVFFVWFFFLPRTGMTGSGDNVSGFAWSGNIGWISFNSTDCDLNTNGFVDIGNCGGYDDASTPVFDYGVNVDPSTGNFSGFAWSPNVGWISFNRADPDTGDPPRAPYNTGPGPIAVYDSVANKVLGWAKILSLGDGGWIMLNSSAMYTCPTTGSTYFDQASCDGACTQTQNCNCPPVTAIPSYALRKNSVASCPNPPGNNQCDQTSPFAEYGIISNKGLGPVPANSFLNGVCCGNEAGLRYMYDLYTECSCPITGGGSCTLPPGSECTGPLACDPFANSFGVSYDPASQSLAGFAWNGNDDDTGIGWISFNSIDCDSDKNGLIDNAGCGTTGNPIGGYEVKVSLNAPPAVAGLSNSLSSSLLCQSYLDENDLPGIPYISYALSWTFIDEEPNQTSYDLQIDDDSDFSAPEVNITSTSSATNYTFWPAEYNTTYYWQVKVYDSALLDSGWSASASFTTPENPYPVPRFYWTPYEINEDESVWFVGLETGRELSQFYPSTPLGNVLEDCNGASCTFGWSINSAIPRDVIIDDSTAASTFIRFNEKIEAADQLEIRLKLDHDIHGDSSEIYSCATSSGFLKTYLPLPIWIEN